MTDPTTSAPPRLLKDDRSLRDYQQQAIDAWLGNNARGILAMATGTGKTFTSVKAVEQLLESESTISLIIVVAPFVHLADQWLGDLNKGDLIPVRVFEDAKKWQRELGVSLILSRFTGKPTLLVTTYTTLRNPVLHEMISTELATSVLIADECHYIGAPGARDFLEFPIPYRLGLSATPTRHFDEDGTRRLTEYFSGEVFALDLAEAIAGGFLTQYDYYPEIISLTESETVAYTDLSNRISIAFARYQHNSSSEAEDYYKRLLMRRAAVVNNAEAKLPWLREKLQSMPAEDVHHILVYTDPGLFSEVLDMIGNQLNIPAHAFTAQESPRERIRILQEFDEGTIKVLVAMRCLDEGVDVPATRIAFFLGSSTNPRQYVQRRGRILRKAPNKTKAEVHDTIVVPAHSASAPTADIERAALGTQFARFLEFAEGAQNKGVAKSKLLPLQLRLNLPTIESVKQEAIST